MWRKRRVKKVVETINLVRGTRVIPIYLLDDGSVVWKLESGDK